MEVEFGANEADSMTSRAKDAATLKRLERRLQLPSVRTSRAQLDLLLADEFVEFGSSGAVFDKSAIIEDLLADPANNRPRYATMKSVKVIWLADGVALVTYRATRSNSHTIRSNRSSIWKRIDRRWQMVFHQGTPAGRSSN
jgi:hypothetical protein